MSVPIQITFHGLPHSDAIETSLETRARHLEKFHDRIQSMRIVVEPTHKGHHAGRGFGVRLEIDVPGDVIVVHREASKGASEDLYADIDHTFDVARRSLRDHVERRHPRGDAT